MKNKILEELPSWDGQNHSISFYHLNWWKIHLRDIGNFYIEMVIHPIFFLCFNLWMSVASLLIENTIIAWKEMKKAWHSLWNLFLVCWVFNISCFGLSTRVPPSLAMVFVWTTQFYSPAWIIFCELSGFTELLFADQAQKSLSLM